MPRKHFFISLLIVAVIGLQLNTFVVGSKYWPFMVYSMFRYSFPAGAVRGLKQRFFCITQGGHELEVNLKPTPQAPFALFQEQQLSRPNIAGVNTFAFYKLYLDPMRNGDTSATQRLAVRINIGREDPVVSFRLESEAYTISESGTMIKNGQAFNYPVGRPR